MTTSHKSGVLEGLDIALKISENHSCDNYAGVGCNCQFDISNEIEKAITKLKESRNEEVMGTDTEGD